MAKRKKEEDDAPEKEDAVVKTDIDINEKGLKLSSYNDLWRFSQAVQASGLAPASMKTPEAVMIAIQFGLEIGLTPMSALQNVAVINGMPSIYGDAAKALVLSSNVCEYVIESTKGDLKKGDFTAICRSKRKGEHYEELVTEFSIEDAKTADLWQKTLSWKKYPKRMLMFRARGFNLRDNFTDILKGFKTAEEVVDYQIIGERGGGTSSSNSGHRTKRDKMNESAPDIDDAEEVK